LASQSQIWETRPASIVLLQNTSTTTHSSYIVYRNELVGVEQSSRPFFAEKQLYTSRTLSKYFNNFRNESFIVPKSQHMGDKRLGRARRGRSNWPRGCFFLRENTLRLFQRGKCPVAMPAGAHGSREERRGISRRSTACHNKTLVPSRFRRRSLT